MRKRLGAIIAMVALATFLGIGSAQASGSPTVLTCSAGGHSITAQVDTDPYDSYVRVLVDVSWNENSSTDNFDRLSFVSSMDQVGIVTYLTVGGSSTTTNDVPDIGYSSSSAGAGIYKWQRLSCWNNGASSNSGWVQTRGL